MKRLFLLTIPALFPLAALAQSAPSTMAPASPPMSGSMSSGMSSSTGKLSMIDTHFIKMAAISGMSEVNDGQLASTMGGTDSVKMVGSTMVSDHTKANAQLKDIAMQKGVTVPAMVDPMHAAINAKLKTLSGSAFDKEYLTTELLGHEKTVALFKTEISTGSDPALKSFASTTLPIIENHVTMIKSAMKG